MDASCTVQSSLYKVWFATMEVSLIGQECRLLKVMHKKYGIEKQTRPDRFRYKKAVKQGTN